MKLSEAQVNLLRTATVCVLRRDGFARWHFYFMGKWTPVPHKTADSLLRLGLIMDDVTAPPILERFVLTAEGKAALYAALELEGKE